MSYTAIDLNIYEIIGIVIAVSTAITVPILKYLYTLNSKVENTHNCIERLEKKILEKELNAKELAVDIKQQIESLKLDISKDVRIQITTLKERSDISNQIQKELKADIEDQKRFFIDWIQRIEDYFRNGHSPDRGASPSRRKKMGGDY